MTPAFDWANYLTLAVNLAGQNDEAARRSAVSRAYYYVYHLAMARALANSFKLIPGEASHKQMWLLYESSPVSECNKLAVLGMRLRSRRERADYDDVYLRLDEEIGEILNTAHEFAALLDKVDRRHPNTTSQRR